MARLYGDENFSGEVVELLRDLGHDVLTASFLGYELEMAIFGAIARQQLNY